MLHILFDHSQGFIYYKRNSFKVTPFFSYNCKTQRHFVKFINLCNLIFGSVVYLFQEEICENIHKQMFSKTEMKDSLGNAINKRAL